MKLTCEKYKTEVDDSAPVCAHPVEYCQFRKSCIINFMFKEREREQRHRVKPERESA